MGGASARESEDLEEADEWHPPFWEAALLLRGVLMCSGGYARWNQCFQ